MNASAIIFSDNYQHEANELTRIRSISSLPVGCRYRAIDFMMSSLVHAEINTIGVITKGKYGSLIDHLGSGKDWDLNRKNGGLTLLTPLAHADNNDPSMMQGKLDALRSVKNYIQSLLPEYVILVQGNIIANIDFEDILQYHIEHRADITTVYTNMAAPPPNSMQMTFSDEHRLTDVRFTMDNSAADVGLGIYIMSKKFLLEFLEKADLYDWHNINRELIIKNIDVLRIIGYRHDAYARLLTTVPDYYTCNMELLNTDVRDDLFLADAPILTRVRDSVPTLYQYNANVENSLLADGCVVDGTVRNSLIFRDVVIEEGAIVENCIIMKGSRIGKNAILRHVITDKKVNISAGATLTGSPLYPYVLTKGTSV